MKHLNADYLIIGAGIVGAAIALELKKARPAARICVIDKEGAPGKHASGRNSGVIHAGFYYSPDSLKARLTRRGNILMHEFCNRHSIPVLKCGKLVVPTNEVEYSTLETLMTRAVLNDVPLDLLDTRQARIIENTVQVYKAALWSPSTASVKPVEVLEKIIAIASSLGVSFLWNEPFVSRESESRVRTANCLIEASYVVNCGGLYADRIARQWGLAQDQILLPFKGLYLYNVKNSVSLNTHVYPVPNISNPFLGVHFTKTLYGQVKIGPTAVPAFWRENYSGFQGFNWIEFCETVCREADLFFRAGFDFRGLAIDELKKMMKSNLIKRAAPLIRNVGRSADYVWGPSGIRAQLVNTRTRKLEMDFLYEKTPSSLHVLNAVSPAFTSSFSMAEYLIDQMP